MTKKDVMTCECGESDVKHNMWYNPNTGDIKCNICFCSFVMFTLNQPKRISQKIKQFIFGYKYPKEICDYYKGEIELV